MSGEGLSDRDARCLWHPYTQHATEDTPLAVRGARGAWLELEDGTRVLDACSSWWTCLHGHGRPELARALYEQAERLDHVLFAGATHEPAVRLAERLVALAPGDLARVFYSDDGSTAVEVALKIAYQAHRNAGRGERTRFLALEGGYHGDTFGAMAVGDPEPFFKPFESLLFDVRRAEPTVDALEAAFAEDGSRLAALIVEPMLQGAAGMRMHGPQLLRAARELCDRHGVFLVADEVLTGFGRTGRTFACEHAGVAPDVLTLAKGLTGGTMPLAATLATEALYEAFLDADRARALFHGHSFTGHPIGCAVALASLDLVEGERTPERLSAIGERLHTRLATRVEGAPNVRDLRVLGGVVAFDLVPPAGEASGYLSGLALTLRRESLARGVLLRPLGNVLYAMPPACTGEDETDRIADTMAELAELARV